MGATLGVSTVSGPGTGPGDSELFASIEDEAGQSVPLTLALQEEVPDELLAVDDPQPQPQPRAQRQQPI